MTKAILFSGRSRGALIHILDRRDGTKAVALCGARIRTKPLFYGRGEPSCPTCAPVV